MTNRTAARTAVIEDGAAAAVALDPVRARLLRALREPGSATSLAVELGLTRQKVNYHLRALEAHGLVELVEERRKGNMTERVLRATASAYVVSPQAWALVAPDPEREPDRVSAQWLLALAARLLREVGTLITRAGRKRVATFAVDGEIRFATAADRAAFVRELGEAVTELVARHHDATAPGGRPHRLVVALHPALPDGGSPPGAGAGTESDTGPHPEPHTESTTRTEEPP
ncbi:helix-turn-helix domain-containing protein [Pseudonocardia kujensis]|uniref:ArsR/SmtB family transcription factor n=1 Tax=Pseudonocardia kujensis TaxID=1128675 RepID=UPI001E5C772A|nr:helix-turn-helix domain-containing protein [Pseudonocardia kujensis]MCE0763216.1 helix-turn-helix domain-containing protein [Pseudonocardia kujensis]